MDFDLSEIDGIALSSEPDQVPEDNLLEGSHQMSTASNDFTWPANVSNPLLLSCQTPSPGLPNTHLQPLPETQTEAEEEQLYDDAPIDKNEVIRIGGLAYAEQCKERAREQCKDQRKKEHMENGNHKFVSRQRKGDKSVNDQDRKSRRIAKNQDSAHAARYAKRVYVNILKKLVQKGEEENNKLQMEVRRLLEENSHLRQCTCNQTTTDSQLLEAKNDNNSQSLSLANGIFAYAATKSDGQYDTLQVAKLIDMLTSREQVSAQAQDLDFAEGRMGIQPSPAV